MEPPWWNHILVRRGRDKNTLSTTQGPREKGPPSSQQAGSQQGLPTPGPPTFSMQADSDICHMSCLGCRGSIRAAEQVQMQAEQ